MTDNTDQFSDWLEATLELDEIDAYSDEDLEADILRLRRKLRDLEQKMERSSEKYKSILEEGADSTGIRQKRILIEAKTYKDRYQQLQLRYLRLMELLVVLNRIRTVRELASSATKDLELGAELSEWEMKEVDWQHEFTDVISQSELFDAVPPAFSTSQKISQTTLTEAISGIDLSDEDVGFVDADFEDVGEELDESEKNERDTEWEEGSLGDRLQATPHTLYQLPKSGVDAYFYYFTDETYSGNGSKFKSLDDCLTTLGRHRAGLEVVIIDRDRIAPVAWDAMTDGLDLESHPALVVAESSLGVREVDHATTEFDPNDVNFATLENGMITDHILQEDDEIRDFLNDLYDAARDDSVQTAMKKEKILNWLTIGKDEIMSILSVQA